jgi:hypothetical protein
VLSTSRKFALNKQFFEENIKESKKLSMNDNLGYVLSKGLNKLKKTFSDLFSEPSDNKHKKQSIGSGNVKVA